MKKINKGLLLVLLMIVVGCAQASHNVSFKNKPIRGGDKFVLTTGCCGRQDQDTVKVIGFIQECILVEDNECIQQIHNTKYFKDHIKPL